MTTTLTMTKTELATLENQIKAGLASFIEVGRALQRINDGRGFELRGFGTFEEYCEVTFGFSKRHGYRMIEAAKTVEAVKKVTGAAPRNEAAAREMARIADQPKLIQKVNERLEKKGLTVATATAEKIAEVVQTVTASKATAKSDGKAEEPPKPKNMPTLSDVCPGCQTMPGAYQRGADGWHCGACNALVLLAVVAAHVQACPHCGSAVLDASVGFCANCGGAL